MLLGIVSAVAAIAATIFGWLSWRVGVEADWPQFYAYIDDSGHSARFTLNCTNDKAVRWQIESVELLSPEGSGVIAGPDLNVLPPLKEKQLRAPWQGSHSSGPRPES